jgi:hypothetical protein
VRIYPTLENSKGKRKMTDFGQNKKEDPDHIELLRLLEAAKPIVMPMFPDQRKKWVAESSLAQSISAILVRHPEYYDEFRTLDGGIFSEFSPTGGKGAAKSKSGS